MSGIRLSPKHGLNPTIPVCFWCGKEKNEIALLGRINGQKDTEAPKHMVLDLEPCKSCKEKMQQGITIVETTCQPNSNSYTKLSEGSYLTGRYVVLKKDAAKRIFKNLDTENETKFLMDSELFTQLFSEYIT